MLSLSGASVPLKARIAAVSYFLPEQKLTNDVLAAEFPEWTVEKIASKTGIRSRGIAGENEFASDLATQAAEKLFVEHRIDRSVVDYIVLCTQSPDFFMPATACIVQGNLGLSTRVGATDISLGCSGYIYALGLAKGLIESGQVENVLVLTADTYSKFINDKDKSVRTIFGDGASATLVTHGAPAEGLYAFAYGTDGSGGKNLIVPGGGLRPGEAVAPKALPESRGLVSNGLDLFMDGPEIFNFTLRVVPNAVQAVLGKASKSLADVDLFVFHQANQYMLEHLRKKLGVDEERFYVSLENSGNTVSSTIPIALREAEEAGALKPGMTVMLLGFGVGYSWGGMIVRW
ncbi:3-oxoacyl-ACP synthase III family protein [Cryobacterium levicorallinum]|uniref:3-oxoacyl-ACP synthase III family protein n=1 Tax=Cryobacterium levicorallinum TaxID=995038 RepID=UPI00241120EC|nr:ketoacyl-ACP synthase III [Cryobacterium levicorallinum]